MSNCMIHFTCQSCSKQWRTPDSDAGRTARCPKCQAVMLIPDPAIQQPERFDFDEPAPPPKGRRSQPQSQTQSGNGALIWIGIAAVVVLVGFVAGFLVYQHVLSENRREYQRLNRQIDDLQGIIIGVGNGDKESRELQGKAEKRQSELIRTAENIWPR
jgi:hypothetical protein